MLEKEILTIDEVARYLRVSERTVYEWAQKGEIPAGKIGTAWRFKKTEFEQWVNSRLSVPQKSGHTAIQVQSILPVERILFLTKTNKEDALRTLAENLAGAPQVKDRQELSDKIIRREKLMSTAIGGSIAIPHIRLNSVTDLIMSVGISKTGIPDFQAMDDEPVKLIFMIAAANNQHAYYLQTLAYISARLKNRDLRLSLIGSQSASDVYNLLINA